MDNLIRMQDAINMIYGCEDEFGRDVVFRIADYIRQLPSIQPEVIHCKDCKYIRYDTIFNQAWCSHPNPKGTLMVFDDSSEYCSRAERKCDGKNQSDL